MPVPAKPPLELNSIFCSSSIEETQAFLHSKDFGLSLRERCSTSFKARLNGVYLPGGYIGFIRYDWAVETRVGPGRNDYWVQLPVRGHMQAAIGNECFACGGSHAVILSPGRHTTLRSEREAERLNLSLTNSAVTRRLSALLNDSVVRPVEFSPALSITEGHGRTVSRYLRLLVSELERADSLFSKPLAMAQMEDFIATALLVSQPHNYSDALQRLDRPTTPCTVRRAIDYIQANSHLPISLAEIVRASGVAGRTLLKHFHDYQGVSPMRYIATVRFQKVRDSLRRAGPESSIAAIAESCGFNHLGRFSVEYRKRFGENPSDTLRRSAPMNGFTTGRSVD